MSQDKFIFNFSVQFLLKKVRLGLKTFAFLSVGFVLVFFGKINKVNLYHAFFKTIEEIQIRNSVGLEQNPAVFSSFIDAETSDSGLHLKLDVKVFGIKAVFKTLQSRISAPKPILTSFSFPFSLFYTLSNPTRAP